MKSICLLMAMLYCSSIFAQTNYFPPSGNAGIGTGASPAAPLHIKNGVQELMFGTGTSSSGYILSMGANDDAANFSLNSKVRGFAFKNLNWNGIERKLLTISTEGHLEIAGVFKSTATVAFFGPGTAADSSNITLKRGIFLDNGASTAWDMFTLQNASGVQFKVAGNGNVGIGANPNSYKLAVNGIIAGRRVKVTQETWADFVFHSNYQLPALSEVENYIRENQHLPGIPTEKQVKEEGVDLGEMNKLLLQKIEEQMLYIIQLNKKVQELSAKIKD